jgi:hypothetical protein
VSAAEKRAERGEYPWSGEDRSRILLAIRTAATKGDSYDPERLLFLSIAIGHVTGRKGLPKLKAERLTREFLAAEPVTCTVKR